MEFRGAIPAVIGFLIVCCYEALLVELIPWVWH